MSNEIGKHDSGAVNDPMGTTRRDVLAAGGQLVTTSLAPSAELARVVETQARNGGSNGITAGQGATR
jgi:hypothetical protein